MLKRLFNSLPSISRSRNIEEASRRIDIAFDEHSTPDDIDRQLAVVEKQRSSSSKLDIRDHDKDLAYVMFYGALRDWVGKGEKLPTYGDPSRDDYLSTFWMKEPILAGAIYSMEAKMMALRWQVTGKRLAARKFARTLAEAAHFDGWDWGGFIASTANDFYTVNRGAFWETARDGDYRIGKLSELGHIDALCCTLTGNKDYSMEYVSEVTSQRMRFRPGEYIHFASMPNPRERHLGIGFCAVDRAYRAAKLLTAVHDYDDEKLNNLPPEGIAAISGLTMEEFMDALKLWKAKRQSDESLTFPQVLWLIGSAPNAQVKVDISGFSQLPESFDRDKVISHYVSTLALVFGVDAREFWPISSGALGTASESEIQHLKAKGKGPGEFISTVERHINGEADEDTQFKFDTQDIEEDVIAAQTAKAWIDAYFPLYSGTPAGKSKASPGGKPNTDMIPDASEIPETGAANQAMAAAGPFGAPPAPEQILTKEQIMRLLTDKGVLPEWLMEDERTAILDTTIHISKDLNGDDYTMFIWDKGILKESRLPPIILNPTNDGNIPFAESLKGGPGSGHRGHVGRQGEVGGNEPGQGISAEEQRKLTLLRTMRAKKYENEHGFRYQPGVSRSKVVRLENDGKAIVKKGLVQYSNWPNDERLEELAYDFSERLGWNMVPVTTTVKDKDFGGSSVQEWIDDTVTAYKLENEERVTLEMWRDNGFLNEQDFSRMAIFDTIFRNKDRHEDNFIFDTSGKMWLIDHNLAHIDSRDTDRHYYARSNIFYRRYTGFSSRFKVSKSDFKAAKRLLIPRKSTFAYNVEKYYGVEALNNALARLNSLEADVREWSD